LASRRKIRVQEFILEGEGILRRAQTKKKYQKELKKTPENKEILGL